MAQWRDGTMSTSRASSPTRVVHMHKKQENMEVLNINVGILGHVDSGKTSLVKALSTVLSTASLDKNPQVRSLAPLCTDSSVHTAGYLVVAAVGCDVIDSEFDHLQPDSRLVLGVLRRFPTLPYGDRYRLGHSASIRAGSSRSHTDRVCAVR